MSDIQKAGNVNPHERAIEGTVRDQNITLG